MSFKLCIVVCSTRPGRVGDKLGAWFMDCARADTRFTVDLADLASINLPMHDEPNHPRLKLYVHEHTRAWSLRADAADAFVFILPEYNYAPPPAFINALDFLSEEWAYKPAGFVSYGGISGGLRAVQIARTMLTGVKGIPVFEGVVVPLVASRISSEGRFVSQPVQEQAAIALLDEIARLSGVLRHLRTSRAEAAQ